MFGYKNDGLRVVHTVKGRNDVVIAHADDNEKAHFLATAANAYREPSDGVSHTEMVKTLVKAPSLIKHTLNNEKIDLVHAVLGISGEAGELLDAIKKHAIYDKALDRENVVEELGDLEFYMEQLRQRLDITRDETLEANIAKLSKRYEGLRYSDKAAHDRADKR